MTAEKAWRRLGAVLVEAGLLSEEDLADALAESDRSGELLGTILVRSGLVSAPAVANALAEQSGGPFRSEHGFGTGLRNIRQSRMSDSDNTEPAPPPVSATEPPAPGPELGSVASTETSMDESGGSLHLLFVPTAQGYLLLQRDGAAPSLGEHIELPEAAAKPLVVVKIASSPLPADPRPCAYLQEL